MKRLGRVRPMVALACLCAFWIHPLGAQSQPAQPSPETQLIAATPAPAPESPPFYERGWFWGVAAGVVVVAVVGGLYAGGVFTKSFDPCAGRTCLSPGGH